MSNSTVVKVNIIGDDRQLAKATKSAERHLGRMKTKLKGANSSIRGLFKGIGVAAAIAAISKFTKAADEDNKSLANLAVVTHNLTNATAGQIKAVDAQIQALQYAVGVADDELRPAYTALLLPLKDTSKAMDALKLATDVAAGTGKDLNTVAKAMAKAFSGNYTALNKLVPGIKDAADPMAELAKNFSGAADAANQISPFKQISIIFQDIGEQLGQAFLPMLREFALYLASPAGKEDIKNFVQIIQVLARGIAQIVQFIGNVLGPLTKWLGLNYDTGDSLDVVKVSLDAAERAGKKYNDMVLENAKAEAEALKKRNELAKKEKSRLAGLVKSIQDYAKDWKDSIDLTMGLNESGTRFRADRVIAEMQRIVDYAKKLPAKLKALAKGGASQQTLNQILGLGPVQGYAVATGLLESGQLGTFNKLSNRLGLYGQQSSTQASTGNYTININKANMTADEIVSAIKSYERKTGRKLLLNG